MATTFEIKSGDIVVNRSNGRPRIIGNIVGNNSPIQAKKKSNQDLQRSLSIGRISNGTGAAINELQGTVGTIGSSGVSILMMQQINNMFSSILAVQAIRPEIRSLNERFSTINTLLVTPNSDNVSFRFYLDTSTIAGETITQSGNIIA